MGRAILVTKLRAVFEDSQKNKGLGIDAFGLADAYEGMAGDSYILGVSAPKLSDLSCYEKMDLIVDILFENLTFEERKMIDIVRVYNSVDELKSHASSDFESSSCDVCEKPMRTEPELFEFA